MNICQLCRVSGGRRRRRTLWLFSMVNFTELLLLRIRITTYLLRVMRLKDLIRKGVGQAAAAECVE